MSPPRAIFGPVDPAVCQEALRLVDHNLLTSRPAASNAEEAVTKAPVGSRGSQRRPRVRLREGARSG